MSHQCIGDAFVPAEVEHHRRVIAATWGHLAPKKNKIYTGFIIFAIGCFGSDHLNPTALECEFEDLDASPWFFEHMMDFLREQKTEAGCVYRFDGTFRNYKFRGKIMQMKLRKALEAE